MAVFFDLDFSLLAFTFHGASKSNIQISPSDPFAKVPFLIFNILAGLMVKVSIILFRGRDSLWYISNERGKRVSTPIAPVAAPEPVVKEVNPQVKKRKKETADKEKSNYTKGTGALKIKLDPKLNKLNETINTGMGSGKAGGLN